MSKSPPGSKSTPTTRRGVLRSFGSVAVAAPLLACGDGVDSVDAAADGGVDVGSDAAGSDSGPDGAGPVDCVLSPEQTEGPFYFDTEMMRQRINEEKTGTVVRMNIAVVAVRGATCEPVEGVLVDLWHADAEGLYSGYPDQGDERNIDTSGQTFCRGLWPTGTSGRAEFTSIFPGWYPGRTTHMHFKVHLDDRTFVTSQLYFPEASVDPVYAGSPYNERGTRPVNNASEGIADDHPLVATLELVGGELVSNFVIGIELE